MGEETTLVEGTKNNGYSTTDMKENHDADPQQIEKTVEFERTIVTENGATTSPLSEKPEGINTSKDIQPPLPTQPKPQTTSIATTTPTNNTATVPPLPTSAPPLPIGDVPIPTSNGPITTSNDDPTTEEVPAPPTNTVQPEPQTTGSILAPIRPSLRGTYTTSETGTGKWEGKWGMDDSAFQEGGITSSFYYESNVVSTEEEPMNKLKIRNAILSGHFMLGSTVPGKPPTKHVEKDVLFEFTDNPEAGEGVLKVAGSGSNAFGSFSLDGKYVVSTGELSVYRTYTGPPVKNSRGRKPKKSSRAKRPRPETAGTVSKPPILPSNNGPAKGKRVGEKKILNTLTSVPTVSERTGRIRRTPSHLVEDAEEYLDSTDDLGQIKAVVRNLLNNDKEGWFSVPVDAEALGILNYHEIIKHPMDLGTIMNNFDASKYKTQEEVVENIRLVFNNATAFNPKGHPVHRVAAQHLKLFENEYKKLLKKQNSKAVKQKQKKIEQEKAKAEKVAGSGGDGRRKRPAKEPNGKAKAVKHNIFSSSDDDDDNEEDEESDDDFEKQRKKRKKQKKLEKKKKKKSKSAPGSEPAEMKMLRKQVEMMNKQIEMMQQMQQNQMMSMQMQMNNSSMQQPVASPPSSVQQKPKKKKDVPLSYQEKRQLGQDIHKLPGELIQGVITIIEESGAPMGQEGDEVELDIEALDTPALRKLQIYVKKALKRAKKTENIDSLVM
mmetsp:Transcript_20981/g.26766  ORF Transcript_20981/g.26766 Transcript_20981/m.26766 type:complete len:718 (-) Transcript_20981:477-2630(-)